MTFLTMMQAIALWCGVPYRDAYSLNDVQACRDKMFQCVHINISETLSLDLDIVATCFQSMSFGQIRKPPLLKRGKNANRNK